MAKASRALDGMEFQHYRARFTGTVDLDDEDAQAAAAGETLVVLMTVNIDAVLAKMDTRGETAGDLARIAVCKATDARVINDPELRGLLLDRLDFAPIDPVMNFIPARNPTPTPDDVEYEYPPGADDVRYVRPRAQPVPTTVTSTHSGENGYYPALNGETETQSTEPLRVPQTKDALLQGFLNESI